MKTDAGEDEEIRCTFHNRGGHTLSECKAFEEKSIEEKTEWIMKEKLCFRCLEANHIARECTSEVTCSKCGSDRHPAILHKEKDGEELRTNCTSVCKKGGMSCGKIELVDVFQQRRPRERQRVYAIMDDQSNASLITTELANQLQADGPIEKYHLTTCSDNKVVKYSRRVPGLILQSTVGATSKILKLPTLIECDHVPQDKHEIPTPETAKRFDHLRDIATEIPL
jgi:hypothetical protein